MRIVVTVKRDAVAKVVLNNLYKHTQLQTSFGCNMLSIVDGVPRTLRLDQMIRLYTTHQLGGHRSSYQVPASQGTGARPHPARSGQGPRRSGRGHRLDPCVADRRHRSRRIDGTPRRRRDPGRCHPRHAAASSGPPSSVRRSSTSWPRSNSKSRTSKTFWLARSVSARSFVTSSRKSSTSTATTVVPASSPPTETSTTRI